MTSQFLIYALVDPRTGKRFYVGQSSIGLERPRQHMRAAELKGQTPKTKRVRALLALGITPAIEVLQYVDDPDEAVPPLLGYYDAEHDWGALDMAEMRWIAHGRAAGWPLTNVLDGGDGLRGLIRTPEHCAKISAAKRGISVNKGRKLTAEHRAKLRVPKPPRSAEHAAKISASNKGKHQVTDEHRAKMSALNSGPGNPNYGKKASPETLERLRLSHLGKFDGAKNPNYGKKMSDEQKAKISATKRASITAEYRAVISARFLGRKASRETRAKMKASLSGANNPAFGKTWTPEHRERIATKKRITAVAANFALLLAGLATIR